MATDVWARNPGNWIKEVVETGLLDTSWDVGYLRKRNMAVGRFLSVYYPASMDWRALVIGDEAGMADIITRSSPKHPVSTHPVFSLEENHPDQLAPLLERHSFVVVTNIPNLSLGVNKKKLLQIADMQEDYPDTVIHLHGTYAHSQVFSLNFKSMDFEVRSYAASGKIILPTMRQVLWTDEEIDEHDKWINLMDYRKSDLAVPRNRCMYNIKSLMWAGRFFNLNVDFRTRGQRTHFGYDDLPLEHKSLRSIAHKQRVIRHEPQDMLYCNMCSMKDKCLYYRYEAVCSVPDAEVAKLSAMFGSRNPDTIINGLSLLLSAQVGRLENSVQRETDNPERGLDPEVNKMFNSAFANGVKLAKLLDPKLNGGAQVGIIVNGTAQVGASTPQQIISGVVAQLEAQGIKREDITPQMIEGLLDPNLSKRMIEISATGD